ncbi:N-acetylglucosamine kinase [Herbiconiux sp. P17]|uniref:N-acetylglucosamine kinase n=1 Tax=Herbiconiux wuyangfengii TaxID=3342794 RepID=UPI0035BA9AEE
MEDLATEPGPDRFLAVDAGNSKTVALVVDRAGEVVGRGRGGRGDIYGADSIETAETAVFGAVEAAFADAGVQASGIRSAAFRLAGVDYPEDARFWDDRITDRLDGLGPRSVKNDGFASLRLLDGTGVGVSITVGTGPAIAARSADGREECSGWFVFDDLGGQGLGNSALAAACRDWMGIAPETRLGAALCEMFGVGDVWELRHLFTKRFGALPRTELWRASRLVLGLADDGDPVARGIVDTQAAAFVRYATWCSARVGVDLTTGELPVLLNGSVVTSEHPAMRTAITERLSAVAPTARVTVAHASPLRGVVLDALAEGGVTLTPALVARVRDDHPEGFLTT